jgi:acetyl esterase/lipase
MVACLGLSAQNGPGASHQSAEASAPSVHPEKIAYTRAPDAANVSYGPHERNVLDLWKAKSERPTPLVIYFHPGAFHQGDKSWIELYDKPLREMLLERGISVASGSYRYAGQAPLPAPMLDCARAIQFLRYHAKEYNLNPKAVISVGASAGAMTSLFLAFHDDMADPASDDPVKRQSTRICAAGSIDGQPALDPRYSKKFPFIEQYARDMMPKLFGVAPSELNTEKGYRIAEEVSPITYLTRDDPPVFMYYTHNLTDQPPKNKNEAIHNPRFGAVLKEPMDKLGIECIFRTPQDYPAKESRPFTKDMVDFFIKYLPKKGA